MVNCHDQVLYRKEAETEKFLKTVTKKPELIFKLKIK